ncbi:MAG: helix-turn-helix transcriptional regulator [Oscillospiraceae bacterium]
MPTCCSASSSRDGKAQRTAETSSTARRPISRTTTPSSITVDDIAAFAGVSRSWLYRGFMQRFGRSPTALLRETRLKTARTLLRGTTMHISEIAWSVGYPDALYFSRVFAASEGCSPSVYRAGQEHT